MISHQVAVTSPSVLTPQPSAFPVSGFSWRMKFQDRLGLKNVLSLLALPSLGFGKMQKSLRAQLCLARSRRVSLVHSSSGGETEAHSDQPPASQPGSVEQDANLAVEIACVDSKSLTSCPVFVF